MKKKLILFGMILAVAVISACEKHDYAAGADGYDNIYYASFVPYNNTLISVARTSGTVIFPVQFHSAYTRSYDAVVNFKIDNTGITNPAVLGQDYNVVNKAGTVLTPTNGKYSITFPKAVQYRDTIYIKLLNSTVAGTRKVQFQLTKTNTSEYKVDTLSTSYIRPLEIK
jgi:hypothetical protein